MATQYDRWQLKTMPIQMPEFKIAGFTPQIADTSLLQQAAQISENRRDKLAENKAALDESFSKMQTMLHHDVDTDKWMQKKKDQVYATIKSYTNVGDYGGALRKAKELASSITSDADYIGRINDNNEYQESKKTVDSLLNNGLIDSDQAEAWNIMNRYHHEDDIDENGRIIGSKHWTPNYMPAKKQDSTQLWAGVLRILNPNSDETSKTVEKQNGNNELSGTKLSKLGFGKDDNAIEGNDAILNISTKTSRSHQKVTQREKLTKDRIIRMINLVIKTNPEAARYYYESYDNAKILMNHYNEVYKEMTAIGNEQEAERAKERVARYKAQIYNEKGKPYANVQDYIFHTICNDAGILMEYYKYSNSISDSTANIRNTDISPHSRPKNYGNSGGNTGENTVENNGSNGGGKKPITFRKGTTGTVKK